MADKADDLNLPAAVVARLIKEAVGHFLCCFLVLAVVCCCVFSCRKVLISRKKRELQSARLPVCLFFILRHGKT